MLALVLCGLAALYSAFSGVSPIGLIAQSAGDPLVYGLVTLALVEVMESQRLRGKITALEHTEAARRDGDERLRAIVNTAVDCIIVIDEHGVVESMNAAGERLFGYTAEEVVGRDISMLMPSTEREARDRYLDSYLRTGMKKIIGSDLTDRKR